ncbi:TIGR01777 family oxidoreductase [Marihabitans asiaticum]|uniref:TIGR01777 family protein n=1 Tax=Marihabitans asiaticum TaxID=415218 RepID=A0A560W7L1_9MICO|nr:TIGR01777 family oxidoreductase [Marihabitans asiaticum]TWD13612.1 hypothetical protein FB557_2239 [Marihabitans asiaticum]
MSAERVVVAGSTGLIGTALCAHLRERGTEVVELVRGESGSPHQVRWDAAKGVLDPAALEGSDVVVNLAGAGVGDKRWSREYKETILRSRVDTTRLLAERAAQAGVARMVAGSAVGFYGDRGEEVLTEASAGGTGFLAEVVRAWEQAADPAREAGMSVAHARTGIVMAREGGAMDQVLTLARLGLGGPLGSGRQFWPLISLVDEVRALTWLIDGEVEGPVNLGAPQPTRQVDLAKELGRQLHRPAVLPAPKPAMYAVLGEFAGEILGSQRVLPQVLREQDFTWEHPDLPAMVRWVLS